MALGLDKIRQHLGAYKASYTIIGGAACYTQFEALGLEFRATKDIDMVLRIDTIDLGFAEALKGLLDAGGYSARQRGAGGAKEYYRFQNPTVDGFPTMLELFIRSEAVADKVAEGQEVVRVEVEDGLISLSAIILDDDYFKVLHEHTEEIEDVSVLSALALIAFKARAFLELQRRRDEGDEKVKGDDIKKHRNDVFRLLTIVDPGKPISVPARVIEDIEKYVSVIRGLGGDFKPKDFKVGLSVDEGLELLSSMFEPFEAK